MISSLKKVVVSNKKIFSRKKILCVKLWRIFIRMIRLGETRSEDKSALICVYSTWNDSDLTSHFPQIYDQVQNHSTFQILYPFFLTIFLFEFLKISKILLGKILGWEMAPYKKLSQIWFSDDPDWAGASHSPRGPLIPCLR